MSALTLEQGELLVVPLELVDEPELAMRETMTDEGLESLVASIKAIGLLQNLVVVRAGDRFRVAAGHRRRVALGLAEKTHVHVLAFPEGTPLEEAAKVAENTEREEVSAAAEATYYRWLLDNRFDGNAEAVATHVNRKLSYVLDKLDLTRGDPAVLEALRLPSQRKPDSALARAFPDHDLTRIGQITQAVAKELNKVKEDDFRMLFLRDALAQGANATTVRQWRQARDQARRYQEAMAASGDNPIAPSEEAPIVSIDACPLCSSAEDQHDMEYVRVHRSCRAVFARQQREGGRG